MSGDRPQEHQPTPDQASQLLALTDEQTQPPQAGPGWGTAMSLDSLSAPGAGTSNQGHDTTRNDDPQASSVGEATRTGQTTQVADLTPFRGDSTRQSTETSQADTSHPANTGDATGWVGSGTGMPLDFFQALLAQPDQSSAPAQDQPGNTDSADNAGSQRPEQPPPFTPPDQFFPSAPQPPMWEPVRQTWTENQLERAAREPGRNQTGMHSEEMVALDHPSKGKRIDEHKDGVAGRGLASFHTEATSAEGEVKRVDQSNAGPIGITGDNNTRVASDARDLSDDKRPYRANEKNTQDLVPPTLMTGHERAAAIMGNKPGQIEIADNPGAKASPYPWYFRSSKEEVTKYAGLIEESAARNNLDPNLVKAAVWLESTHGWYDEITGLLRDPKSLRPMNIYVDYWKDLGLTRESLSNPRINIEAGAYLLASISRLVKNPTPEKIFTLYNNLRADSVSSYGKTAVYYYHTRPWEHSGGTSN